MAFDVHIPGHHLLPSDRDSAILLHMASACESCLVWPDRFRYSSPDQGSKVSLCHLEYSPLLHIPELSSSRIEQVRHGTDCDVKLPPGFIKPYEIWTGRIVASYAGLLSMVYATAHSFKCGASRPGSRA